MYFFNAHGCDNYGNRESEVNSKMYLLYYSLTCGEYILINERTTLTQKTSNIGYAPLTTTVVVSCFSVFDLPFQWMIQWVIFSYYHVIHMHTIVFVNWNRSVKLIK